MDVRDPLRNKANFAHPPPTLLNIPEAMLVIKSARTILHYVEEKLATMP